MSETRSNCRGLSAVANAFSEQPLYAPLGGAAGEGWGDGDLVLGRALKADAFSVLEPLEARELMSVSLDAAGWTVVTPAADSRIVYVSSSKGSDANSGLSSSSPLKSLSKAIALVRPNSGDQLLLKRGDTFVGNLGTWTKSGRSADQPILISAYGIGDRPLLKTGTSHGITFGSASARNVSNVAVVGLHFWADGRDPAVGGYQKNSQPFGINVVCGGSGLLVEDVKIEKFMTNMSVYPTLGHMSDVTLRRSILVDAYGTDKTSLHSQGFFADGVSGLTLEGNVFDHNGWHESIPGAEANIYNHNAYITGTNTELVVRGNIFANASSHGLQARPGGVIVGNLFLNNPIGLSFGLVNGSGVVTSGGVSGEVTDNVFYGSGDIDGAERGVAMQIANIRPNSGTLIKRNVVSSYTASWAPAIDLSYGQGVEQNKQVGINDLMLVDNVIYNWTRGISVSDGMSASGWGYKKIKNVILRGNKLSAISKVAFVNTGSLTADSRSTVAASTFSDPSRNIARYNKTLGGVGAEWQFMVTVRDRDSGTWDSRYTATGAVNYVRGGFGLAALPGGGTTIPPAIPPVVVPPVVSPPVVSPPVVSPPVVVPPPVDLPVAVPPTTVPPVGSSPDPVKEKHQRAKSRAAVYVKKLKAKQVRGVQTLIVKFSREIGASIDASDLSLTTTDGQAVNTSGTTVIYDSKKKQATFVLPHEELDLKGKYTARLISAGIVTEHGNLDGNRDRIGGDDFVKRVKFKG